MKRFSCNRAQHHPDRIRVMLRMVRLRPTCVKSAAAPQQINDEQDGQGNAEQPQQDVTDLPGLADGGMLQAR